MSLRILGGKAKGLPLLLPPEGITRPTSSLLRRRPFDFRQDWDGWCFVDLCAGSGSMGLEAWSRGARQVLLVEAHPKVLDLLGRNLAALKERCPGDFAERPARAVRARAEKWVSSWAAEYARMGEEDRRATCV